VSGLLLAAARESAPVTNWPERLALTALTVGFAVGVALLMRRGWRRRTARQADVPQPPDGPLAGAELTAPADGTYVTTTAAGDWLDRITVHDLGVRSTATLRVTDQGVHLAREGARDLLVPAGALIGARLEPGMAGKFVGPTGLVVVRWHLGDREADTGFRAREVSRQPELIDAINNVINREVSA
jgi:hypothetical protein